MASLMLELDLISRTMDLIKSPNGSKEYPTLSCCHLKHDYPDKKTGLYLLPLTVFLTSQYDWSI